MLVRLLANHPDIELIMQPFNGSNIRLHMNHIMSDELATEDDVRFFSSLAKNQFYSTYINSGWHNKFSTVWDFQPGKLHIIKTTLNHLASRWMLERFPAIPLWGVWRNPYDILASIHRNGFFEKWYGDSHVRDLIITVRDHDLLRHYFGELHDNLTTNVQKTAYLITVRSWFFFYHLPVDNILIYEKILENPNPELERLLVRYQLHPFNFEPYLNLDYNISGKSYKKGVSYRDILTKEDLQVAENLFTPLFELMNQRFGLEVLA